MDGRMPIHVLDGVPRYEAELDGVGAVDVSSLISNIGAGIKVASDAVGAGLDMASRYKSSARARELMQKRYEMDRSMADAAARKAEAEARIAAAQANLMAAPGAPAAVAEMPAGGSSTKRMLLIGGGVLALGLVAMLALKRR